MLNSLEAEEKRFVTLGKCASDHTRDVTLTGVICFGPDALSPNYEGKHKYLPPRSSSSPY